MTSHPKDRILDAYLEELLGEQAPPDLKDKILSSLTRDELDISRTAAAGEDPAPSSAPPVKAPLARAAAADASSSGHAPLARSRGHRPADQPDLHLPPTSAERADERAIGRRTPTWIVALSILLLGVVAGILSIDRLTPPPGPADLADGDNGQRQQPASPGSDPQSGSQPSHEKDVATPWWNGSTSPFEDSSPRVARGGAAEIPRRQDLPAPLDDDEVVRIVDRLIAQQWKAEGVVAAQGATDAQWCQRVYHRLIGRSPTQREIKRFTRDKGQDKRGRLVDTLTASDEYAQHWADVWAQILLGTSPNAAAFKPGLERYLRAALEANRSYDRITYELLTAEGSAKPEAPGFNGATAFLLSGIHDKARPATVDTARLFLGQSVQCAQCHDHPSNPDWTQQRFWELNAFFRQIQRTTPSGTVQLVERDFKGEGSQPTPDQAELYYERPDKLLRPAYPVLPDGTAVSRSGKLQDINRRAVLAGWLVQSEDFSRATVNRLWTYFFRFGFSEQVDDLGQHRSLTHPQLLDQLADQFAAHEYDLRSLTRWISLSQPLGLSEQLDDGNRRDVPEFGQQPLFSRFYARPVQRLDFTRSLAKITTALSEVDAVQFGSAQFDWLNQRGQLSSDGGITAENTAASPPEPVAVDQLGIGAESSALLAELHHADLSDREKVQHVFQAAAGRPARGRELAEAMQLYGEKKQSGSPLAALELIWLAIVNSNKPSFRR